MTGRQLLAAVLTKTFEPAVGNELVVDEDLIADEDNVVEWEVDSLKVWEDGQRRDQFTLTIAGKGGVYPGRYRITLETLEGE